VAAAALAIKPISANNLAAGAVASGVKQGPSNRTGHLSDSFTQTQTVFVRRNAKSIRRGRGEADSPGIDRARVAGRPGPTIMTVVRAEVIAPPLDAGAPSTATTRGAPRQFRFHMRRQRAAGVSKAVRNARPSCSQPPVQTKDASRPLIGWRLEDAMRRAMQPARSGSCCAPST
jgi:hypothetical protein